MLVGTIRDDVLAVRPENAKRTKYHILFYIYLWFWFQLLCTRQDMGDKVSTPGGAVEDEVHRSTVAWMKLYI